MEPVAARPKAGKSRRLSGVGGNGRRLSAGWRVEDAENFLEENDDESERAAAANQKLEEAEKLAKKTRSPFKETPNRKARTAVLTDMYSDAIQMCAENKINEKNSWALDLIDHMGRMIEQPSGGDASMTNFQFASSTLDAGVKIYAYRVDSVYNETYKLIGGLNRAKSGTDDEPAETPECGDGAEADGAEGCKTNRETKRHRRTKPQSTNLEANPASLDIKKLDMAFDVDPLFHRTSAKFDEGGAKGLLLINLPVRPGNELSFDSSESQGTITRKTAPPARVPLSTLHEWIPQNLDGMHICSELACMVGSIRNGVTTGTEGTSDAALRATAVGDPEDISDEEADSGLADNDDDGASAWVGGFHEVMDHAPFDGDDADCIDEDVDAEVEAREKALMQQLSAVEGESGGAAAFLSLDEFVEDAQQGLAVMEGVDEQEAARERVLRLLQVGQRWAGPSHWKFKATPAVAASATGAAPSATIETAAAASTRGKGKTPFLVDFQRSKDVLISLQNMDKDAKGTTLTNAALAKEQASSSTLPRDLNCTPQVLSSLFLKPGATIGRRRRLLRQTALHVVDDSPHADNLVADSFSDGGDDAGLHCADDDDVPVVSIDESETNAAAGSDVFRLIDEPTKVEQIQIGYARVAKQVDIKGLKTGVWQLVQDADGEAQKSGTNQVSFREVLGGLHAKVPAPQLLDVSFAYCFISLLHLANEHGLEVQNNTTLDDLRVIVPRT